MRKYSNRYWMHAHLVVQAVIALEQVQRRLVGLREAHAVLVRHDVVAPAVHHRGRAVEHAGAQLRQALQVERRSHQEHAARVQQRRGGHRDVAAEARADQHQIAAELLAEVHQPAPRARAARRCRGSRPSARRNLRSAQLPPVRRSCGPRDRLPGRARRPRGGRSPALAWRAVRSLGGWVACANNAGNGNGSQPPRNGSASRQGLAVLDRSRRHLHRRHRSVARPVRCRCARCPRWRGQAPRGIRAWPRCASLMAQAPPGERITA